MLENTDTTSRDSDGFSSADGVSYSNNDIAAFVIALWRDLLKIDAICLDDCIFDLGAGSIQVTIFLERVKQQVAVTITPGMLYKLWTLRDISDYIVNSLNA